jgi:drug/metabolite transporter (DMT)-like permease
MLRQLSADDPSRLRPGTARNGSLQHLVTIVGDMLVVSAHVAAVIWSPNLGVFAVAAAGVLCAFPASWTRYLDSVFAVGLVCSPCRCCFLELSGYCVNAVWPHVNAADVLVRCGKDRDDSR